MDLLYRFQVRLLSTRLGATVFRHVSPPVDRFIARHTSGRWTMSGLLFPVLVLTTIGRRSGQPRQQPLVHLEDGDAHVVVGSNWGQDHHPAWTHNLLANPEARITVRGRDVPVTARLLEGSERDERYRRFVELAPNYGRYLEWSGDREIRVFELTPR